MSETSATMMPAVFREHHPADHDAVAVAIALCWFLLLAGFVPDMVRGLVTGHRYVLSAHLHAASAFGWMVLLSWQALKIRGGRQADHRRHGRLIGGWLLTFVVLSALVTVWTADRARLAGTMLTPDGRPYNPAGLAFQLGHVIPFVVLTGLALMRTDQPALHKRLLLLGMFAVLDTGWSRWLGPDMVKLLGPGWAGQLLFRFPASWIMLAGMAWYDQATRGRLHPAFLPAAGLIFATQLGSAMIYFTPGWSALARRLLGA
ncbi:MAG: hypothetical protein K2Q27_13415 [Novosphingobium sp.]|uniref:hypothetical protein n=1 Tax=Novosphingobium sp. NDB2Meth1 TaxID=1892847 RepID=UPI000B0BC3FC|nr:hypothetical protein [Novosphingobium sp. NDB2Meth1]MBY0394249.1 hypothetical protein [Novosphingobium sp.]